METLVSNLRFVRAVKIVRGGGVQELRRDLWSVRSQSHSGSYLVDTQGDAPGCTCPDAEAHATTREHRCKHAFAVLITAKKISKYLNKPEICTSSGLHSTAHMAGRSKRIKPVQKRKIEVTVFTCLRCDHVWLPRRPLDPIEDTPIPKKCAACGSNLWNVPRQREIADENKARKRGSE